MGWGEADVTGMERKRGGEREKDREGGGGGGIGR